MTNNLTPRPEVRGAIVGVDTHKHIHVAVAIDTCGIHLGDQSFAADSGGYQALLTWAALLHESELARTDPDPQFLHRPMRYDIGLPSPVI